MNIVLLFFKNYWKELIIGVLCAVCAHIFIDWRHQSARIDDLQAQLESTRGELSGAQAEIEEHARARVEADKRAHESVKKRQKIITDLGNELNKLRSQTPPSDCAGAIEWGIERKGDLEW